MQYWTQLPSQAHTTNKFVFIQHHYFFSILLLQLFVNWRPHNCLSLLFISWSSILWNWSIYFYFILRCDRHKVDSTTWDSCVEIVSMIFKWMEHGTIELRPWSGILNLWHLCVVCIQFQLNAFKATGFISALLSDQTNLMEANRWDLCDGPRDYCLNKRPRALIFHVVKLNWLAHALGRINASIPHISQMTAFLGQKAATKCYWTSTKYCTFMWYIMMCASVTSAAALRSLLMIS